MPLLPLILTACAPAPTRPEPAVVQVPVAAPCLRAQDMPDRPQACVPRDDSRPEWLRCKLSDCARKDGYIGQLEAVLSGCAR